MRYGDLVSVIIPLYNRAHSVERAVYSVLCQTYRELELIVVDDGSTDGSAELVEAIDDPRLRLIRHATNSGAGAARSTGIEAARSDLVAFQDSDDIWLPHKLATQMECFSALSEDHVLVFSTELIYGRGIENGRTHYGPRLASCVPAPDLRLASGDLSRALLGGNFITPQATIMKRSAYYRAGGFDRRLKNNEDWDLYLRLSQQGPIGFVEEPLVIVYDNEDGISKNPVSKAFSMIVIFGKLKRQHPRERSLAIHALTVHRSLTLKGKPRSARRFLVKALSLTPNRPALWARYLLSLAPGIYTALLKQKMRRSAG